jgi:hypothetical protein
MPDRIVAEWLRRRPAAEGVSSRGSVVCGCIRPSSLLSNVVILCFQMDKFAIPLSTITNSEFRNMSALQYRTMQIFIRYHLIRKCSIIAFVSMGHASNVRPIAATLPCPSQRP